jgi:hypothetical protein
MNSQGGGTTQIRSADIGRPISNTTFATLVREAWVGTRGLSSTEIGGIVRNRLGEGTAVVAAVERRSGQEDLRKTASRLGF